MNEQKLKKLYNEEYFDPRESDIKRVLSYKQELQRVLNYIDSGNVLDVGCGKGEFLELFGKGWNKYGIEISDYASKVAGQRNIQIIDYNFHPNTMDLILFRGTLQHLDKPLWSIQKCLEMLKPDGYMIFLATPNINSIYYRFFKELPALDPKRNFMLPSDIMIKQILENLGLKVLQITYPYKESPYSNLIYDHINFFLKIIGFKRDFAFWGNMMECYAKKT